MYPQKHVYVYNSKENNAVEEPMKFKLLTAKVRNKKTHVKCTVSKKNNEIQ